MTQTFYNQGLGVAGRFGGLLDPFANLNDSQIVILPVAFDQTTTYQHGTDKGPAALIEASRHLELYDIETDTEVYLKGIHTLSILQPQSTEAMLQAVHEQVQYFLKRKKVVVTLGGEHTISYAAIQAYSEHFESLSILQLDAHADLQDQYEGNPWSHACVMARVLELRSIHQVVSVGVRSLSSEEKENLKKTVPFFAHQLVDNDDWMLQLCNILSDVVYVTFDLDVFDSSIMPSTGTPEPGGLNWTQVTKLLKLISQNKRIVGFDVVELCPNPAMIAPDFLAAKLVYKLLSYQFKWCRHENT
jgi:agmatinase